MGQTREAEMLAGRVRHVYDQYRTAIMNSKYYGELLEKFKKRNTIVEIVMAIMAPGAIGAWAIWKEFPWDWLWRLLAASAALLAVLKPILDFQRQIERYSKLWAKYTDLTNDYATIVAEIQVNHAVSAELERRIGTADTRHAELSSEDDPVPEPKRLLEKMEEVKEQVPADSLWVPEG